MDDLRSRACSLLVRNHQLRAHLLCPKLHQLEEKPFLFLRYSRQTAADSPQSSNQEENEMKLYRKGLGCAAQPNKVLYATTKLQNILLTTSKNYSRTNKASTDTTTTPQWLITLQNEFWCTRHRYVDHTMSNFGDNL